MSKISKYTDIVVLIFIGYLITIATYQHFTDGIILSLNFYIGVAAWLFTVYTKIVKKSVKYGVFILLFFALFNIILFTASVSSFGKVYYLYKGDNLNIVSLGLDPFTLLILLIYFLINRKTGLELCDRIFYGSANERQKKNDKQISFYYKKFSVLSEDELIDVYKEYKNYPFDAQNALKKIHEERRLSLIEF